MFITIDNQLLDHALPRLSTPCTSRDVLIYSTTSTLDTQILCHPLIYSFLLIFRLIIINAIYFKGDWLFKFDEEKTEAMEFHVDDDQKVDHPYGMKLIEALRMANIEELGADVLEMPYKVKANSKNLHRNPQCHGINFRSN